MIFQPTLSDTLSSINEIKAFSFYKDLYIEQDDPEHIHTCYEIYINVSGDVSFLHNKSIYPIEPGDIIICAPCEVHYCIYHSSCVHKHFCIWFDSGENSLIDEYIKKHGINGHIRLGKDIREEFFSLVHKFDRENDSFEKTMYFFELLKFLKEKNTDYKAENSKIPDKMKQILEYVDENYADIRFVEEIADKFHLSIPTLNRWFREYAHLPPGKLLTAKKLAHAEKLLRNDYTVSDACFMSGFADCSRFISTFKAKYGITPLQYKKTKTNN